MTRFFVVLLIFAVFAPAGQARAGKSFQLDRMLLFQLEQQYGWGSRKRLEAWEDMINKDAGRPVQERLEKVNSFFNKLKFVSDLKHWKQEDYWATPVEFIASGGGDCEDFSVAKYFTLKEMGIPERKLGLIYVKALGMDQAHMVMAYFELMDAEPLILDNLIDDILPASERRDLLPIYSFNGSWLWVAKRSGRGELVARSEALSRWRELLARMEKGHVFKAQR